MTIAAPPAPARWCILRTSAGQTLPLADSLARAGIAAWTPRQTIKRAAPTSRRAYIMGQRPAPNEVTVPILPGFVFAGQDDVDELLAIGNAHRLGYGSAHPRFTMLQVGDRVPFVGDRHVAGLRQAEVEAAAAIAVVREAETREAARRARAERLGSERARQRALRRIRKDLAPATPVTIDQAPALVGKVGEVVSCDGTTAIVNFGGPFSWTIEAWRLLPSSTNLAA